jgi:glycolate oxidase FAD binding subunit
VRAGTPLAQLEAVLAERGQMLPFEPPHFGRGHRRRLHRGRPRRPAARACGAPRDFVLGVTLMNGRGEVLRFGGRS